MLKNKKAKSIISYFFRSVRKRGHILEPSRLRWRYQSMEHLLVKKNEKQEKGTVIPPSVEIRTIQPNWLLIAGLCGCALNYDTTQSKETRCEHVSQHFRRCFWSFQLTFIISARA